jgi:hypothetical protein
MCTNVCVGQRVPNVYVQKDSVQGVWITAVLRCTQTHAA